MTPTFIVIERESVTCLMRTIDLTEAQALTQATDAEIAVVADGVTVRMLVELLHQVASSSFAGMNRRLWRLRRIESDPRCDYCRRWITAANATVDHKLPRSRGGRDIPENYALACNACNGLKGTSTLEEFRERLMGGILFAETEVAERLGV